MDASALASELDRLEKYWSLLDAWLKFWVTIVVIGVVVEVIPLVKEYWDEYKKYQRASIHLRPPEKPHGWLFLFDLMGVILVAIGVSGELAVHFKASNIETKIRDTTRQLVAIAEGDAGNANREAARLRKDAEGLKKQAEDERMARLKLQEQMTARILTPGRIRILQTAVEAFPRQPVQMGTVSDAQEATTFELTLGGVLSLYWNVAYLGPGNFGIPGVLVRASSDEGSQNAANALVAALNRGMPGSTIKWPDPILTTVSRGLPLVQVIVGDHPMFLPK